MRNSGRFSPRFSPARFFFRAANGQLRKQQAEDLRDLAKIAGVLAVITVGYFEFAPEPAEDRTQVVSIARASD